MTGSVQRQSLFHAMCFKFLSASPRRYGAFEVDRTFPRAQRRTQKKKTTDGVNSSTV